MPRGKKFTAQQIIGKLREAEVGLVQGKTAQGPSGGCGVRADLVGSITVAETGL
jgi:hypothetical protein